MLSIEIDGETHQLPPKQAVEMFLAMPGNENLLKNNLMPGANTSKSGAKSVNGSLVYKRSDIAANPKVRSEYLEKIKKGESVSIE
jgi:hypothetical protein